MPTFRLRTFLADVSAGLSPTFQSGVSLLTEVRALRACLRQVSSPGPLLAPSSLSPRDQAV